MYPSVRLWKPMDVQLKLQRSHFITGRADTKKASKLNTGLRGGDKCDFMPAQKRFHGRIRNCLVSIETYSSLLHEKIFEFICTLTGIVRLRESALKLSWLWFKRCIVKKELTDTNLLLSPIAEPRAIFKVHFLQEMFHSNDSAMAVVLQHERSGFWISLKKSGVTLVSWLATQRKEEE